MEKRQGTPSCLICGASLTSARRTLHPPIPANQEARSFFLQFVVGASAPQVFQANIAESPTEYACKPCFGKLERASKHHRATCSLIGELRTSARASGRISVAGNEPDYMLLLQLQLLRSLGSDLRRVVMRDPLQKGIGPKTCSRS